MLKPTAEVEGFLSEVQSASAMSFIPKIVYGEDNRVDVEDSEIPLFKTWSQSTAAQVSMSEFNEEFKILSPTLKERLRLCPGERFAEQLTPARCSGFFSRS
jgi:hypothetical protein